MKYIISLSIILIINFIGLNSFSQKSNWNIKFLNEKPFIENKGQFDGRDWHTNSSIKYAIDNNNFYVFFTDNGLTYRFDKFFKNKSENEKKELKKRHESEWKNKSELVSATWVNSNKDVEITPTEKIKSYYSYSIKDKFSKQDIDINNITGYNKIFYNNLYDNVDV